MKLLTKDLLLEYGFVLNIEKTVENQKVYCRDKMNIILKNDETFYYSNLGINNPVRDTATLRKLYKAVNSDELKPVTFKL